MEKRGGELVVSLVIVLDFLSKGGLSSCRYVVVVGESSRTSGGGFGSLDEAGGGGSID